MSPLRTNCRRGPRLSVHRRSPIATRGTAGGRIVAPLFAALATVLAARGAQAQQDSARGEYLGRDRVKPAVSVVTTVDPATGEFVYRYTLSNGQGAEQRIHSFSLELAPGSRSRAVAPDGWRAVSAVPPEVTWSASTPVVSAQPAYAATGSAAFSPRATEIAAGKTMTGFVLRSACAPRDSVVSYAVRGYNERALPAELPGGTPDTREDAVRGTTGGPGECTSVADWGSQDPDIEGLIGVVNFADRAALPTGAVAVQVRFARDGEHIFRTTFRAQLNGQDVTGAFVTNARGDRVAVFAPRTSPVVAGWNSLVLSVDGWKKGTATTVRDEDRVTFKTR